MSTDPEVVQAVLKDAVKDALRDLLSASMRPAVIASDSGVSSVTLEKMATGTKPTVKVYHEDPREAQRLARLIYEEEMNYWHDHDPSGGPQKR